MKNKWKSYKANKKIDKILVQSNENQRNLQEKNCEKYIKSPHWSSAAENWKIEKLYLK